MEGQVPRKTAMPASFGLQHDSSETFVVIRLYYALLAPLWANLFKKG
jgi:hypothetical protein